MQGRRAAEPARPVLHQGELGHLPKIPAWAAVARLGSGSLRFCSTASHGMDMAARTAGLGEAEASPGPAPSGSTSAPPPAPRGKGCRGDPR